MGPQIPNAGVLLGVERVSVFGGTALDDVGNIDVGPLQVDEGEHQVQEFSRRAHEGFPLKVLLLPWAFPDEEDVRLVAAHAEDHVGPGFCQGTGAAVLACVLQFFPTHHGDPSSLCLFLL